MSEILTLNAQVGVPSDGRDPRPVAQLAPARQLAFAGHRQGHVEKERLERRSGVADVDGRQPSRRLRHLRRARLRPFIRLVSIGILWFYIYFASPPSSVVVEFQIFTIYYDLANRL